MSRPDVNFLIIRLLLVSVVFSVSIKLKSQPQDSFQEFAAGISPSNNRSLVLYDSLMNIAASPYQKIKLDRLLGNYYFRKNKLDSALLVLDRALESTKASEDSLFVVELAKVSFRRNDILNRRGNYVDGTVALKEAINLLERHQINSTDAHDCYFGLGKNYQNAGEYQLAEAAYIKSLNDARNRGHRDDILRSYTSLGVNYEKQLKFDLAKEHYYMVLSELESRKTSTYNYNWLMTAVCNNMAVLFKREGKIDSALIRYNMSLEYLQRSNVPIADKLHWKSYLDSNLGSLYSAIGQHEKAVPFLKNSLDYLEDTRDVSSPEVVQINRNIAQVLGKAGRRSDAIFHFNKAIKGGKHDNAELCLTYGQFAEFYLSEAEFQLAQNYFDSANQANRITEVDGFFYYQFPASYASNLFGRSEILKSRDIVEVQEADRMLLEFDNILTHIYANTEYQNTLDDIPIFVENLINVYREVPDLALKEYYEVVWRLAGISKGAKLQKQLRNQYSLKYSLPNDVLMREQELKDSINSQLALVKPNVFDSVLFVLKRKYEVFVAELEENYPDYFALKNSRQFPSLVDVQERLRKEELVLDFFEGVDSVYLMKVTQDKIHKIAVQRDSINDLIDEFNESLFSFSTTELLKNSRRILTALELSENDLFSFKKINIVADGIIWKLNFAALSHKVDNRLEYLGNVVPLSFDYFHSSRATDEIAALSEKVLAFSYNEKEKAGSTSYATFRDLDASLPGTSQEVASIASIWSGDYFYADQASESTFKSKGQDYGILHLAVHGYQNERYPENSFLQFNANDSLNDGRLYAYELYNMRLNAELAVLSACNSGDGKILTGEGMMSMGRSFAYAGVKSLLASRWEVPDITAPYLMKYFYYGLKEGMRKSEALKYAQTQFLKNDADNITSAPFYWAGFYVIGDDGPLKDESWVWLIILTTSSILVLVGLYLKRRFVS